MLNHQEYYSNIIKLREKILCDLNLKKNINIIKNRKFNVLKEANKTSEERSRISKINKMNYETVSSSLNRNKLPNVLNSQHNITFVLNTSRNTKDNYTSYIDNHLKITKKYIKSENILIKRENSKFKKRLNRVTSPLRLGIMEKSYEKTRKYSEIARKIKSISEAEEAEKRNIIKVKGMLPPLVVNKIENIKKIISI